MNVYIAVCQDRHTDVHVKVFTTPDKAIEYAKAFIREHVAHPEHIIEEEAGDWLYFARYSLESDYIFVERGVLDEAHDD